MRGDNWDMMAHELNRLPAGPTSLSVAPVAACALGSLVRAIARVRCCPGLDTATSLYDGCARAPPAEHSLVPFLGYC